MELKPSIIVEGDVMVIGGGGAGIRAAIEARRHNINVIIVSSSRVGYGSNTAIAGGAIAAITGQELEDSPEKHFQDTITAGHFINNQILVDIMVRGARQQIYDLIEFGVKFEQSGGGFKTRTSPGHSSPRTISCEQQLGTGFSLPMAEYARGLGIQFKEGVHITKLLKVDRTIVGAMGLDKNGQTFVFNAKSTVLATGGLGQIFLRTNNAVTANGTGYALAYEAGVPLADMEFTQFYPTSLANYGGFKTIPYGTLVATGGASIKNSLGEDILDKHGIKDPYLMTRDMLTRAVVLEILHGNGIDGALILDLSDVSEKILSKKIPFLSPQNLVGVREFRIAPTVHYHMGGVKIDESAKTEVDGLYAAGEVCGGIHGANRLGSNSFADIFVFGMIAGDSAANHALRTKQTSIPQKIVSAEKERLESLLSCQGPEDLRQLRQSLRETMWSRVGIVRDADSLKKALVEIDHIRDKLRGASAASYRQLNEIIELDNMLLIADIMTRAALLRMESRGSHYRSDYPAQDNKAWLTNIVVFNENGQMRLVGKPVELLKMSPR